MEKTILVVVIDKRRATAPEVQKTLTTFGCLIKTRLGIHDGVVDKCSDHGLLILELIGNKKDRKELQKKLGLLPGVKTKSINISA